MRKIEKETLEIINNFQGEKYSHLKKLKTTRENQIKEEVENHLQSFIEIERIKNRIEEFKKLYDNDISVHFVLEINSYYTDYHSLFDKDKEIQNSQVEMHKIEEARNKMKLILQNSEIKSEEYSAKLNNLEIRYQGYYEEKEGNIEMFTIYRKKEE